MQIQEITQRFSHGCQMTSTFVWVSVTPWTEKSSLSCVVGHFFLNQALFSLSAWVIFGMNFRKRAKQELWRLRVVVGNDSSHRFVDFRVETELESAGSAGVPVWEKKNMSNQTRCAESSQAKIQTKLWMWCEWKRSGSYRSKLHTSDSTKLKRNGPIRSISNCAGSTVCVHFSDDVFLPFRCCRPRAQLIQKYLLCLRFCQQRFCKWATSAWGWCWDFSIADCGIILAYFAKHPGNQLPPKSLFHLYLIRGVAVNPQTSTSAKQCLNSASDDKNQNLSWQRHWTSWTLSSPRLSHNEFWSNQLGFPGLAREEWKSISSC